MERITIKTLEPVLARIARETGAPTGKLWSRVNDRNVALVGALFIEQGSPLYGHAWNLCRMVNESGGQSVVLSGRTARDLYERMQAYLRGMADATRGAA